MTARTLAAGTVRQHRPSLPPNGRVEPDQARPWAINDNLKSREGQWTPQSSKWAAVMVAERAGPVLDKLASSEKRIEWGAAALGVTILLQTAGIVWWASRIDQRVATVEQKVTATSQAGETLARLDERTQFLVTTVNRLDQRQQDQEAKRQ